MKLIIDIDEELYNQLREDHSYNSAKIAYRELMNGKPYEEGMTFDYVHGHVDALNESGEYKARPQGKLANEVWKLYEKYHPYLATSVIEFGDELKDLLGKYQRGGEE